MHLANALTQLFGMARSADDGERDHVDGRQYLCPRLAVLAGCPARWQDVMTVEVTESTAEIRIRNCGPPACDSKQVTNLWTSRHQMGLRTRLVQ